MLASCGECSPARRAEPFHMVFDRRTAILVFFDGDQRISTRGTALTITKPPLVRGFVKQIDVASSFLLLYESEPSVFRGFVLEKYHGLCHPVLISEIGRASCRERV